MESFKRSTARDFRINTQLISDRVEDDQAEDDSQQESEAPPKAKKRKHWYIHHNIIISNCWTLLQEVIGYDNYVKVRHLPVSLLNFRIILLFISYNVAVIMSTLQLNYLP